MSWPPGTSLLYERYTLIAPLGGGEGGEVWAAADRVTRAEVALKALHADVAGGWTTRRELAALHLLRLPGVVRLLDEGEVLDPAGRRRAVVVMEHVAGPAFPDGAEPWPWEALRGPAVGLLRVLARVHQAGVVHRDLKPAHVRLHPTRGPVLLDFGAACGVGVSVARQTGAWELGSPRWMAPEQAVDAEDADPRSDLYAVGVMLYEALCGRAPHPGADPAALLRARRTQPPTPLDAPWPVPSEVQALVLRLLRPRRADRPRTAEAALALLGEPAEAPAPPRAPSPEERRLGIRPPAAEPGRSVRDALARGDLDGARAQAQAAAAELWVRGRIHDALAALEPALPLAGAADHGLLVQYTLVALAEHTPEAAERALYEWRRSNTDEPLRAAVIGLLRAHRAAQDHDVARGLACWSEVPPLSGTPLERWRWAVRVDLAQRQELEQMQEAVEAAWAWARADTRPEARADAEGWEGLAAYRSGDYARAARLCGQCAETKLHTSGRLSAMGMQGAALLELAELERADEVGERLADEARACGLPVHAANGEWLCRAARYRAGRTDGVDEVLVRAARLLRGADQRGRLLMTEAAVAWRHAAQTHAPLGRAHALATEACAEWAQAPGLWRLAEALRLATAPTVDPAALHAHAALLGRQRGMRGLALQGLGVLCWALPPLRAELRPSLEAHAAALRESSPALTVGRRELMTLGEALHPTHTLPPRAMEG